MIKFTESQKTAIINALPEHFFEKYEAASKIEKTELTKTLTDYLEYLSELPDRRRFIYEEFGVDIEEI
ncbi:MAG: hypothetical protein ACI4SC_03670 [Candidatus Neoclostridium sp.]